MASRLHRKLGSSARRASIRGWPRSRCRSHVCSPRRTRARPAGAYALAKISGLKYLPRYLSRQYGTELHFGHARNLYGSNDNYHPTLSRTSGTYRRFSRGENRRTPSVTCWGGGSRCGIPLYGRSGETSALFTGEQLFGAAGR